MGTAIIDRRTFLKAVGLSGAGTLAARAVLAATDTTTRRADDTLDAPAGPDQVVSLANALDYDLERIYRFVTDEIRYEPYPGVLRGANGTLSGRAGNSADQAILLAALLKAAAIPHRFATGAIDDATAAALLDAATYDAAAEMEHTRGILLGTAPDLPPAAPRPTGSGASPTPAPTPGPPSVTPTPSLDPASQALADGFRQQAGPIVDTATAQLTDGLSTIGDALTAAGVTVATAPTSLPASERDQHVWVQVLFGATWLDLDPTRPGAQRGETLTTAERTLTALPDELRHQVQFLVNTETVVGTQLVQDTIGQHSSFADELYGQPVTFLNTKPSGLSGLGLSIGNAIQGGVQYVPLLIVGDTVAVGRTPMTIGAEGGLLGAMGDGPPADGQTTAQWLEVHLASPGSDPVIARRTIFDRIGDAARSAGGYDVSTLQPVQLVDLDATTTDEYLPCRTTHSFAVLGGALNGAWFAQDYSANGSLGNVAVIGHLYHTVREALSTQLAVAQGVRIFPDGPNVVSYSVVPNTSVDGTQAASSGLDIWHRSLGTMPVRGAATTATPAILAGVLSHVAERTTLGDGRLPEAAAPGPISRAISVGRLFETARAQGVATRVVSGATIPADLTIAPPARPILDASLQAGYVAVMPERPVTIDGVERSGWWLVDPQTGRTLDQMDDGSGEMAEYVLPYTEEWKAIVQVIRIGDCIAKYGTLMAIILGAASNADSSGGLSTYLSYAAGVATAAAESGMPGSLC